MLKEPESEKSGKLEKVVFPYQQVVGSIMYLMTGSRPDLAYSIGVLSKNLENPSPKVVARVKR